MAQPHVSWARTGSRNRMNLRSSVQWEGTSFVSQSDALHHRLTELLVLELHIDGGSRYLNFSVRSLYRHVLDAISSTRCPVTGSDTVCLESEPLSKPSSGTRRRNHAGVDTTAQPKSEKDEINITYRERLGGYLHPRDMRRLVTPFSASNEPALLVRRHVMLLNFDPLRAIILRDRLIVLVPDGADSLLAKLERLVRGTSTDVEDAYLDGSDIGTSEHSEKYGDTMRKQRQVGIVLSKRMVQQTVAEHDNIRSGPPTAQSYGTDESEAIDEPDEWDEMKGSEWIDLPFELRCADACLHTVCEMLAEDAKELHDTTIDYINRIINDVSLGDDPLTIIRAVKDAIREMSSRVQGFVKSINRTLDEDEDMALMNLSRLITHPERFIQPVPSSVLEEESDEAELLLESHLQTAMTMTNALNLIQGQIDSAAELVDQKLDSARNKILFANMLISVGSLCVATASLVGSMFGMNIGIPVSESTSSFYIVTFVSLGGAFSLGLLIMFWLVSSGTMPRARSTGIH